MSSTCTPRWNASSPPTSGAGRDDPRPSAATVRLRGWRAASAAVEEELLCCPNPPGQVVSTGLERSGGAHRWHRGDDNFALVRVAECSRARGVFWSASRTRWGGPRRRCRAALGLGESHRVTASAQGAGLIPEISSGGPIS
ncbi:HalD/BesD family halogenase [Nocardia callitridis]|uniref:HalD/BesD family halogenase n=1 Tax=Nocardia callitridis TaxID=648753 RepID=UPI003CD05EC3